MLKIMGKSAGALFLFLGVLVTVFVSVMASDPDLTTDIGITSTNVADFTFTGFRNLPAGAEGVATPTFAFFKDLPGLTGLGLTAAVFEYGTQSQVSPHTHPRASELVYVTSGQLDVGFVDTNNTLFETTLYTGDLFVFPKGLIHWLRNNQYNTASGFFVLSSENPGILTISSALFTAGGKGLPDDVLSAAFGTSVQTIDAIKGALIDTPHGE